VPVYVPLPPFVVSALRELNELFPERPYYFWTGAGKFETAVKSWKRTLATVFERAGVKGRARAQVPRHLLGLVAPQGCSSDGVAAPRSSLDEGDGAELCAVDQGAAGQARGSGQGDVAAGKTEVESHSGGA
jgi:hypothetical protein